jgi:ketosteroid isomerase-like protein
MTVAPTAQPSEHPNRVVARRLWAAIAAADFEELREIIAPKSVWRMYGESPLAGTYEGVEAILGFLASVGERADELRSDLLDIFVSDRGAVLRYSIHALRGDRVLDIEHLFLARIDDGRVVEAVFAPIDQHRYDRFWEAPSATLLDGALDLPTPSSDRHDSRS